MCNWLKPNGLKYIEWPHSCFNGCGDFFPRIKVLLGALPHRADLHGGEENCLCFSTDSRRVLLVDEGLECMALGLSVEQQAFATNMVFTFAISG